MSDLLTPRVLSLPAAIASKYARPNTAHFDDLVSAGMYQLARSVQTFDPTRLGRTGEPIKFSSYAFNAIRFRIKKHADRHERSRLRTVNLEDELADGWERKELLGKEDEGLAAEERREILGHALRKLDPVDREMLLLWFVDGLRQKDIAERLARLGVTCRPSSIGARLRKALRAARLTASRIGCNRGRGAFADPSKRGKPDPENAARAAAEYQRRAAQARRLAGKVPAFERLHYVADHQARTLAGPFENYSQVFASLGVPLPTRVRGPAGRRINEARVLELGKELLRGPAARSLAVQRSYVVVGE